MKKSETCHSEAPESPEKTVPKPCEFLSQSKLLSSTQPVSSANLGVRQSLDHPKLSSLLSQTHRKATFQAVLGAATQKARRSRVNRRRPSDEILQGNFVSRGSLKPARERLESLRQRIDEAQKHELREQVPKEKQRVANQQNLGKHRKRAEELQAVLLKHKWKNLR